MTLFASRLATREVGGSSGSNNFSGQSSWTFFSVNIGTANATRYVVVTIGAIGSTSGANSISSVTIGGSGATIHTQTAGLSGTTNSISAIAGLAVASGTTATIVVNTPSQVTSVIIGAYGLYNLESNTPTATGSASANGGSVSCTANVAAGSVQISASMILDSTTLSFSNITKDGQVTPVSSTGGFASDQSATAATPRTFTCSGGSAIRTICAAVWK